MMRFDGCAAFAAEHGIIMTTVEMLSEYRAAEEAAAKAALGKQQERRRGDESSKDGPLEMGFPPPRCRCGASGGGGGNIGRGGGAARLRYECVVCMEEGVSCVFLPCRHLCVCEKCAERIMASAPTACPKCRAMVEGVLQVFV